MKPCDLQNHLALKLVAVIPTYVSSLSPHITIAWYTTVYHLLGTRRLGKCKEKEKEI